VTIIWRPAAARDYASLREYFEAHAPASAEAVANRIFAAIDSLTRFPRRGRPGDLEGTRELVVARTPYIVVYRIDDDEIVILRVIHGAQRWPPTP
jgi:toxin ParE1/3/4